MGKFDERGREIPDPTPIEIPANARRPESMQDTIARLVRQQVNQIAQANEAGSFEEEDDFDDPTEAIEEPHSDHYIVDAVMQPVEPGTELDGPVDLNQPAGSSESAPTPTASGEGSPGSNSTSDASQRQHGVEAPQE